MGEDLQQKLDQLTGAASLWLSALEDFEDEPLETLLDLPDRLGFSTPFDDWLDELADEYERTVGEIEAVGLDFDFDLYQVLNGFEIGATYGNEWETLLGTTCAPWGDGASCQLTPPLRFFSICDSIIPGAGETCTEAEVEAAIQAIFADRVAQLMGLAEAAGGPALNQLLDDIDNLSGTTIFGLQCAALDVSLSLLGDNTLDMALESTVFGQPVDLFFGWNFNDPLGSALKLLDGYFGGGAGSSCAGVGQGLFGPGELGELVAGGEAADLAPLRVSVAVSPGRVDEGQSVTATVSFDREVTAADGARIVTLNWGDGSTESVTVDGGERSTTRQHTYADDNPTGTSFDTYRVKAIDTGAGGFKATASVVVANVAPSNLALQLDDATIDENGEVQLTVAWTDPGADTFSVRIVWGDGATLLVPEAVSPVMVSHRYLDDRPTGTPGPDAAAIRVRVRDDDGGQAFATAQVQVSNINPASVTLSPLSVLEGDLVTYTISFVDIGTLDTHAVMVDWGNDGSFEHGGLVGATRTFTFQRLFADDDPTGTPFDLVPVRVRVVDDDTGLTDFVTSVTVNNVEPKLCIVVDPALVAPSKGTDCSAVSLTIDEYGSVTVRGVYQDPGVLDTHTVEIDWGYSGFPRTTFSFAPDPGQPNLDGHSFEATQTYGDNGVYTITVTVKDDDTGDDTSTATITVNNINPSITIDEAESTGAGDPGTLMADGSETKDDGVLDEPTFVVRQGQPLAIEASASDPGSDDLTFSWTWGDTLSTTTPSLVNPSLGPDPALSPTNQPRVLSTSATHSWTQACLYSVGLSVLDDDGGTDSDDTWVLVTGTERRIWAPGYWYNQYDLSKKNQNRLVEATLDCYLRAVNHLSRVFGVNANVFWQVSTFTQMRDTLNTKQTSSDTEIMQRQLMAAWLNFVNGSIGWFDMVDTNGDRVPDRQFSEVMRESETLRLNPAATRAQLLAQEAILKIVNGA